LTRKPIEVIGRAKYLYTYRRTFFKAGTERRDSDDWILIIAKFMKKSAGINYAVIMIHPACHGDKNIMEGDIA
jgi:hypothetical protein